MTDWTPSAPRNLITPGVRAILRTKMREASRAEGRVLFTRDDLEPIVQEALDKFDFENPLWTEMTDIIVDFVFGNALYEARKRAA